MSSQNSINKTFDVFSRLLDSRDVQQLGWSAEFCKQAKKDIAEMRTISKEVNYYGGLNSLLEYAKRGAGTLNLFDAE